LKYTASFGLFEIRKTLLLCTARVVPFSLSLCSLSLLPVQFLFAFFQKPPPPADEIGEVGGVVSDRGLLSKLLVAFCFLRGFCLALLPESALWTFMIGP